jgi:nucleoid-associated protein YgaU
MPSTRTMPENRTRVVRPHESLWTIARERHPDATDAEISLLWPAWYESNRAAIGPDPNYLRPGQHLLTPASDQSEDHR